MDFTSGNELKKVCEDKNISISEAMKLREIEEGGLSELELVLKIKVVLEIMKKAANEPITKPQKSMGGLIGGEAKLLSKHLENKANVAGSLLSKAIMYAVSVLEVNASMGLIVAAPTAGSSGVLPGVLLSLQEEKNLTDEELYKGIENASAIGYLLMRNASVSGAEAGCQAEVGAASAMAASAVVELMGGSVDACFQAASLALSNLLGMVCDPIAGLVESPCQSRNAIGVANAITSAEMALAGIKHPIPFDEMAEAMLRVGRSIPFELRETAMGGNATTATGCSLACKGCIQ
jgi:L-serine dehydratase